MTPLDRLGLAADADERAVKRAYAQLLRLNHPDEHPQEFAALHALYRAALQWVRTRDARQGASEPPPSSPAAPEPPQAASAEPAEPAAPQSPRIAPVEPSASTAPNPSRPLAASPDHRRRMPRAISAPGVSALLAVPTAPVVPASLAGAPPRALAYNDLERLIEEIRALVQDPDCTAADLAHRLGRDERLQSFVVRERLDESLLLAPPAALHGDSAKLHVLIDHFGWDQAADAAPIGTRAALRRNAAARALVEPLRAAEAAARAAAEKAKLDLETVTGIADRLPAPRNVKALLRRLRRGAEESPAAPPGLVVPVLPIGAVERWLRAAFLERRHFLAALAVFERQAGPGGFRIFDRATLEFFTAVTNFDAPISKRLPLIALRSALAGGGVMAVFLLLALLQPDRVQDSSAVGLIALLGAVAGLATIAASVVFDTISWYQWRSHRRQAAPTAEQEKRAAQRRRRSGRAAAVSGGLALVGLFLPTLLPAKFAGVLAMLAAAWFRRRPLLVSAVGLLVGATMLTIGGRIEAICLLLYAAAWIGMDVALGRWRSERGWLVEVLGLLAIVPLFAWLIDMTSNHPALR